MQLCCSFNCILLCCPCLPDNVLKLVLKLQGAPETIQERLIDVPSSYVTTYKKYTRQGSRVLALAYKPLPEMAVSAYLNHSI